MHLKPKVILMMVRVAENLDRDMPHSLALLRQGSFFHAAASDQGPMISMIASLKWMFGTRVVQ
tara:strand:+ start:123 stop:311 length:189 start_codon:yes stop_codon:yes gene_type:complete